MKKHFEARTPEWFSAALLFAWGTYSLLHPSLFYHPATRAFFSGMLDIASPPVWGLAALLAGNIRLVALFINGKWGLTPAIRVITSFMSVFVWFYIAVGSYSSGVANFGVIIYPALCLSDMYSAFRAASDAYQAEAMRRLKTLSEQASNVSSIRRVS